jgi:CRP/FNR family transcriptional regulator, cyclic AMP receptor protein
MRQNAAVVWQLLAPVSPEVVRRVLSIARRRSFSRGEVVFHRGDPANSLHLVAKGRFAVRITTPLGHAALLTVHGPGGAFGELALLEEGGVRSATVSALEPGETFAVYREEFELLRREFPAVDRVLAALLAVDVRRLSERLVEAYHVDAETRVLRRLHDAAALYGADSDTTVVPLTQEDLADLAGTSRATVNRVLRAEERRGTVALGRGRTTVLDRAALEHRSGRRP